jgi:hypothetical protein
MTANRHEATKNTKEHEEIFLYKLNFERFRDLRDFVAEGRM